jgi:hypothetical protein
MLLFRVNRLGYREIGIYGRSSTLMARRSSMAW